MDPKAALNLMIQELSSNEPNFDMVRDLHSAYAKWRTGNGATVAGSGIGQWGNGKPGYVMVWSV